MQDDLQHVKETPIVTTLLDEIDLKRICLVAEKSTLPTGPHNKETNSSVGK